MAIYYVSTTGSDGAAGSEALPWLTIQHAINSVVAGDIINVLPGTYMPSTATASAVRIDSVNGTSGAPITLRGFGGRPVIDASALNAPANDKFGLLILHANWWVIEDLDVTGAAQVGTGGAGVYIYESSNNRVERVRAYSNEGLGFGVQAFDAPATNNVFLNCDSYDNYDPITNGANGDGFNIGQGVVTGTVVDGCRAWHNADDGFDLWEAESVVILRNCWSWNQGVGTSGGGTGFKLGRNDTSPVHQIYNCLSFDNNGGYGFNTNAAGPIEVLNNTAFNNTLQGFFTDTGVAHVLRNNISDTVSVAAAADDTFNSWNLAVSVSAADFVSVSQADALAARSADGSLPVNGLFRLVPSSDLVNVGTNVGLPFRGPAPDLGAFELADLAVTIVKRYAGSVF